MGHCAGCEARDSEISFLRSQVTEMQDRLLALTNPAGYQIYKGMPLAAQGWPDAQGPQPVPVGNPDGTPVDPGDVMMFIGGRQVKRSEYEQTMAKVEEQMSGRSPGDGQGVPV